jgi:hypothetical protein
MHIYVYRITNLINNKEYIGVHTTSNLDDGYMGSGLAIMRAVKKHGACNFRKEIIKFFNAEFDAYDYELQIVNEEYVAREDTYNMTLGGKKPPARKGVKLNYETRQRFKQIANTPERRQSSSDGGNIGIRHVKENGWSTEAIAKRVKTRQERNGYAKDMSKCHTPEALAKREKTKKINGVKYNTINANSPTAKFQREKTKYIKRLNKISKHYDQPVSVELIRRAKEEGVDNINLDTLLRYFTIAEIDQLSYVEQPVR